MTDAPIYDIHWDRNLQLWFIHPKTGDGTITAKSVILNSTAVSMENKLRVTGVLQTDRLVNQIGLSDAAIGKAIFHRPHKRPGVPPKVDPMLEWHFMYDENGHNWALWRLDQQRVVVETRDLRIDSYCHSTGGGMSSHSEMILNGKTNTNEKRLGAESVKLRELTVYDQIVPVKPIASRGTA